jgi:hypothetical protein
MITAKKAKQFYDDSGHEIEQFLTLSVEKEVVNAAKSGKCNTIIHLGSVEIDGRVFITSSLGDTITPLQKAAVDKLKELGYHAEIKLYGEPYVYPLCSVIKGDNYDVVEPAIRDGRGYGIHQGYGIHISWK